MQVEFYIYTFMTMVLMACVVWTSTLLAKQARATLDFMDNAMDSMNKLAQLGMIHAGSKNAAEANQNVAVHENQLLDLATAKMKIEEELEEAKKPKRKLVGFYGKDPKGNDTRLMFERQPSRELLAKIPESRRIYQEIGNV